MTEESPPNESAQLYDAAVPDWPGEIAFYRQHAAELGPGGALLEVACGTGRVAAQLARDGLRVVGFDRSADFLAGARAKTADLPNARWVRGDMRDIDLGDSPHFLLKEIREAPNSFHKTLRAKIAEHDGLLRAVVGERALPTSIATALADGVIRRVLVIGQGTAAVAGRSVAQILDGLVEGGLDVDPIVATELSGFGLRLDMSDTLVIAVSQSGTTTDTEIVTKPRRVRQSLGTGRQLTATSAVLASSP